MSQTPEKEFKVLLEDLQDFYGQINYYRIMVKKQKRNVRRAHMNVAKGG